MKGQTTGEMRRHSIPGGGGDGGRDVEQHHFVTSSWVQPAPPCEKSSKKMNTFKVRRSAIFFSHYLINGTIFATTKKVTEHKMCVLIFCTTFM